VTPVSNIKNIYQQLVVVEDRVEVLDPLGVDVSVEDDPLPLVDLASHVVDDSTEDVGEQTVTPLAGVWVLMSMSLNLLSSSLTLRTIKLVFIHGNPFSALSRIYK
jgi:hypothetical protein